MLRVHTLPGSLSRVLDPFRPCFNTPTFATFVTLLAGMIVRPAHRTVCGMLAGAGLADVWHHSRAHRFFAAARWHPDPVGLAVLRLIVGHLVPIGAPLTVAVDDTLFRRSGRRVYAAHWGYDGSLKVFKGNQKLSRGNTFVVAAVVVMLPFLDRPVALPVLARLWRKGGPAKTVLARELVEMIAAHTRGRTVHVVADGAYLCTELRRLPAQVTLTGPLRSNASLWHTHPDLDHPPRLRGRGRPRTYAARIGTPADLAATTPATSVTVTRYGRTSTIAVHQLRCLWRGVFGARPVRVLVITEPGKPDLALVTTDLATPDNTGRDHRGTLRRPLGHRGRVRRRQTVSVSRGPLRMRENRCTVARRRRGPQKAIVATGNSVLTVVYYLLSDPTARFRDLGADYFTTRIDKNRRARSLAAALQAVTGQKITIQDGQAIIEAQAA